jgi:hypothetical protein
MRGVAKVVLASSISLAACTLRAETPVESKALKQGKGILVLQCGSDWCVSGESVRQVFESEAFRRSKAGSKFVTAIYDDMDNPTDRVKAANDDLKPIVIRTKRFPAITCYTPGPGFRFFAQIENLPQNITPEILVEAIDRVTARKDRAEALFREAEQATGEAAADLYGQGFNILVAMIGPFHFKELTTGNYGWKKEWEALKKLDQGDRFGWVKHFEMDEYGTLNLVERVTGGRENGKGRSLVESMKAVSTKHFTANQRQCVKVMEYALTGRTDKPLSDSEMALLKEAFAMGRNTFWGQFAMGRLMMAGEKIESNGLPRAEVRTRQLSAASESKMPFPLDSVKQAISLIKPGENLTDRQKLAVARYAVLRLIGEKGWAKLAERPGSSRFLKAFFNDRKWLEDFAWSGTFSRYGGDGWEEAGIEAGSGEAAALALEELVFQDDERWVPYSDGKFADNEGRRFMTALALSYPGKDAAWLADVLDAYRATALAGRLHKSAYSQPVWMWRFAVHQGHGSASCDNMAAQQRHLDKFVNLPEREYGGTCWMVAYRDTNCFGDSVQGPWYYRPWATAGEWPKRRYSQIVGGVCGELSKFGSATANAHGLPSTTVGQPAHCAYARRLTNGTWTIDYSVTGHSQMHFTFWNKHPWQYSVALEKTYFVPRERRLGAERMVTLARFAEDEGWDGDAVEKFYRYACAEHPAHYGAWLEYGAWLRRARVSLDRIRVWVRGCARGMMTGRQPLWDLLAPYFERVAKERGAAALRDDLVDFAPLLRQGGARIQEEADFGAALEGWGKLLGSDLELRCDVLKAMLDAQYGTDNYFSQTLGWGSDIFMKTPSGVDLFVKCLGEVLSKKMKESGGKPTLDFKPLILAASRSDNLDTFRKMAALQAKFEPNDVKGRKYPKLDFGGELLGAEGMLKTSSTSQWDNPSRYVYTIDDSPCGGNGFHTGREKAPWAQVTLPGPTALKGIVIENREGGHNGTRQVPLYVDISEDGTTWRRVYVENEAKSTFRVDLRDEAPRTKYVRVGRVADAKDEFFHLNKILVYGTHLY